MAANNYCGFSYGGTQYGAAAAGAAYPTPQAGYAVAPTATAAYGAQRAAGYDQAYQAAATQGSFASYRTQTYYSAPPTRNFTPVTKGPTTTTPSSSTASSAANENSQIISKVNPNTTTSFNQAQATSNTTTYSNYDAALYSAATMYVAQQTSKANANGWQPYKKPGSQNVGGNKSRVKPQPRPQQLHYCEVCKISCAGPQTYREHLEGQKHKKREASLKMQATATAANQNRGNNFHCELCDVTCTGNDAYAAHVRGSKHQKVVKLHQKLGKPIPSTDPKKLQKMNFIAAGDSKENNTVTAPSETQGEQPQVEPEQEQSSSEEIKPVGVEYIEEIKDEEGKILSFNCKLCECKFNDPNAKEMHMKGRRHRLQYKRKVQPDLVVDFKPTPRQKRLAEARAQRNQGDYWNSRRIADDDEENMYWDERRRYDEEFDYISNWSQRNYGGLRGPMMSRPNLPIGPPFFGMMPAGRRPESSDDRHVIAHHAAIYPKEEELQTIQKIVSHTERALKFVSDALTENKLTQVEKINEKQQNEEKSGTNLNSTTPVTTNANTNNNSKNNKENKNSKEDGSNNQLFSFQKETEGSNVRLLKGVMRVGLLAKGLLLQGDNMVQLVVLCAEKPTRNLLKKVAAELPIKLKEVSCDSNYNVDLAPEEGAVLVLDEKVTVKVSLTSPLLRDPTQQDTSIVSSLEQNVQKTDELLPREPCLQALASLRHAKWFQARATSLQSCVMIMRIMRDLCHRNPTWQSLTQWAMELLVEKVISSGGVPLSPGDCLRRIMEALSTGLLINGPGILDPCEKEPHDALHGMTKQQREDITVSAQQFLRYVAFRQIHKVLGMDPLPAPKFQQRQWRSQRKRKRSGTEDYEGDAKTSKKEGENGEKMDAI